MPKCLFLIPAIVFLLHMPAQAQEKAPHWSIGVTAGAAFPVGTFAGYHSPIQSTGGVSIGESAELSAEYRISKSFSVAMAFNGQLDHGAGVPYFLTPSYYSNSAKSNTGFKSDWRMTRLLAGGVYTIPLSKRQGPALFVRLLAGVAKIRTPDYSFNTSVIPNNIFPSFEPNYVTLSGASLPLTFSYEMGLGFKWPLSRVCALLTYAGYTGTSRTKENSTVIYNCPNGGCGMLPPSTGTFVTETIFLRTGVAFWL